MSQYLQNLATIHDEKLCVIKPMFDTSENPDKLKEGLILQDRIRLNAEIWTEGTVAKFILSKCPEWCKQ